MVMNGRPHILHVIDSLNPGGAERMAVEIANATDPNHYHVTIGITRSGQALACKLKNHVNLFCLGRRKRFEWPKLRQFQAYCQAERVDLLHVHGRSSLRFVAFVNFLSGFRMPAPLFHDHDGSEIEFNTAVPLYDRFLMRWFKPRYYVGVHPRMAERATSTGLDQNQVKIIRNAVDLDPYIHKKPCQLKSSSATPLGIIIANIRPPKDIVLLLRALSLIKDLDWRVQVVGGVNDVGYWQYCQQLQKSLGLQERVSFIGRKLNVKPLLDVSDFALMSSCSESGPLVLLEYAASGLPFVSTRVGAIGKTFEQYSVPEFVEPGNVTAFAAALRRLLQQLPAEREGRGQLGLRVVQELFDIQAVMPLWYQAYEGVLRKQ